MKLMRGEKSFIADPGHWRFNLWDRCRQKTQRGMAAGLAQRRAADLFDPGNLKIEKSRSGIASRPAQRRTAIRQNDDEERCRAPGEACRPDCPERGDGYGARRS